MRGDPLYDLEDRLLDFCADVSRFVERLPRSRTGNHVAGQLLRCGTSPLPNHGEAQAAESRDDFIHKMSICLKELRETLRWLRFSQRVPLVKPASELDPLLRETDELIRIFYASIRTAHANAKRPAGPATSNRRTARPSSSER